MIILVLIQRASSSVKKQMQRLSIIIGNTLRDEIDDRVLLNTYNV